MRLDDSYVNYIIISAYQSDDDQLKNRLGMSRLSDDLVYKDFNVLEMGGRQPSYLAYRECDNDELRYDAIELMDRFKQEYVIIKYKGEKDAKKILFDGQENLLGIVEYSGNEEHHNFYVEGAGFSFEPRKRYWTPKEVRHFKEGMIVEYKDNSGQWIQKEVKDPEVEFERLYKLLIKYDKIRIEFKDIF